MKFLELKKHLQEMTLSPAYLLTGDDSFVIKTACDMFKNLCEIGEMNVSIFNQASTISSVIDALECMPVMDKVRVVIAEEIKVDSEALTAYLKKPNPFSVLVLIRSALKDDLSKILPKLNVVDCNRLDTDSLLRYIAVSAQKAGAQISVSAASLLISYCGSQLSRISKETEKLAMYKAGGVIEKADVESFVTAEAEYKIYELSNAVVAKQPKRASEILQSLIDAKISPVTLVGMMYSHFRRLLYCAITPKTENLHTLLGVKEYAAKMSAIEAAKFSPKKLKAICDSLHKADYSIKSGLISDKTAVEMCVMQILTFI